MLLLERGKGTAAIDVRGSTSMAKGKEYVAFFEWEDYLDQVDSDSFMRRPRCIKQGSQEEKKTASLPDGIKMMVAGEGTGEGEGAFFKERNQAMGLRRP